MKRGQIIAPTGSGKTLIEHNAVNSSIDNGGMIHVILAPRISLVHQLLNEFWNFKSREWSALCVCSQPSEFEELYENEDLDKTIETTTSGQDIADAISKALLNGQPINIFGTLHSAGRIAGAKCGIAACSARAGVGPRELP